MKILRVDRKRYFLVELDSDLEQVALKLLNERRVMDADRSEPKLKEFIERITDEQDGDLALSVVHRLYKLDIISPEVL